MNGVNEKFVAKLCNERHEAINRRLDMLEKSHEDINKWLVASLTALCLNLLGMIMLLVRSFVA